MSKVNVWAICVFAVFSGSVIIYFEDYRNCEWINLLADMLIFGGWIGLYVWSGRNTILNEKQIPFKENWVAALKQVVLKFAATIFTIAVVITNMMYLSHLAHQRKIDILNHGATQTTIAEIDHIEARKAKSSTTYYAVFQYTVNGQQIIHPWRERNEYDFKAGDKYEIKYSVAYPEMFLVVRKVK